MAGSYGHVNLVDGKWSLIENMGDAYECVEELLWLVARLTHSDHARITKLLDDEFYPMCRGELTPDTAMSAVKRVMEER
jgi:hypothetical protein